MRLGIAVPEHLVSAPVLNAALEATTRLDEAMLAAGSPTLAQARHRVRWRPEPPGQEHFDHLGEVLRRGAGDCDDLAPWHAASLRHTGKDPGAEAIVKRSGPKNWHAVVRRSDGSIDDPSAWLGMGPGIAPFVAGCGGIVSPLPSVGVVGAYIIAPRLAAMPLSDGRWSARADLPWNFIPWNRGAPKEGPLDIAMAALHRSPVASQSIAGAADGARSLLDSLDDDSEEASYCREYLDAVTDAHLGADWEDLADVYGDDIADHVEENVGKLWKKISRAAKKVIRPARKVIDSKAAKFVAPLIPGGGQVYMLARGASAASARKGNLLQKAKGFGGGIARGGMDYLDNPLVQEGVKIIPGMDKMAAAAREAAAMAAEALEHTPKIVRDAGVAPKLKKLTKSQAARAEKRAVKKVKKLSKSVSRSPVKLPKDVREIVIRL